MSDRAEARRIAAGKRAELGPLRKRIKDAEAGIVKLEREIAVLDEKLAAPGLYERDPAEAARLGKARAAASEALGLAEESWLELSASYEEAQAAG